MICFKLLIVIFTFIFKIESATLSPIFTWNQLMYDNPPDNSNTIVSPYIGANVSPYGLSYHVSSKRIFLTVPRLAPGIPSTVNYIDSQDDSSSPLLKPYPDYQTNTPEVNQLIF